MNSQASGRPRVSLRDTDRMNRTSSGIAGVLDNMKNHIAVLDQEIKADKVGKKDYERELFKLETRKEELLARVQENEEFAKGFERDIGPFEQKYMQMTAEMARLYGNAKEEHAKGLQVLIDEFYYHPAYKRYRDTFTAVPFKPK